MISSLHTPTGESVRTNIVLDEQLVAEAMRRTGIKTKRAVVEEALRTLIQPASQEEILVARKIALGRRLRSDAARLNGDPGRQLRLDRLLQRPHVAETDLLALLCAAESCSLAT